MKKERQVERLTKNLNVAWATPLEDLSPGSFWNGHSPRSIRP
jgi:hypothetical protein